MGRVVSPGRPQHALLRVVYQQRVVHRAVAAADVLRMRNMAVILLLTLLIAKTMSLAATAISGESYVLKQAAAVTVYEDVV